MAEFPITLSIRRVTNRPNLFEFIISTPMLVSQFRLPRAMVNKLRILIEKALTNR